MTGKRRRKKKLQCKSKYLFNSFFEEKKVSGYLLSLINSKFIHVDPEKVFVFAQAVLGQKAVVALLEKRFPEIVEDEEFEAWVRHDRLEDNLPHPVITDLLKEEISLILTEKIAHLSRFKTSDEERRLGHLEKAFHLSREELAVISFFYLEETCRLVDTYFDDRDFIDLTAFPVFRSYGPAILGISRGKLINSFTGDRLFKNQLIEKTGGGFIQIAGWCENYLSGIGEEELSHQLYCTENNETLTLPDFELSKDEMDVIATLIKKGGRQNLLLYGSPGTGKTSFARALAKHYKKEILIVKTSDIDEHKDRLRAIIGTINLADKDKSMVLIDEADELLNSCRSYFFESKTNKSWINNLLEDHDKKVIWITNRCSEIDPSTMRRFAFSVEFKKPDHKKRLKVLKCELHKKGLGDYFSREALESLCRDYSVDAGGIVNAMNVLNVSAKMKEERALKKVRTVLKSHEKMTARKKQAVKERDFKAYSLKGLNTSKNLEDVISGIRRFLKREGTDQFRKISAVTSLLYGMPGTGKTEFVYYLGNTLGKEVVMKRCSEIQDCWVGSTEKNVAAAFAEAEEKEAVLFFDEADSFLYPRTQASHSWEKDFTNEFLTQLESFKGIAFCATNHLEGLDHAALRRFRFKIEFRPLTPEGNLHFYKSLLMPLLAWAKRPSALEIANIKAIRHLTPGDFAVVKDQALFMADAEITHRFFIDALIHDVSYKQIGAKNIGFNDE